MITSYAASLRELFQKGRFRPARNQREFQWRERQVRQLVDDLVSSFRRAGLDPEPLDAPDETVDTEGDGVDNEGGEEANTRTARTTPGRTVRPTRFIPDRYYLGSVILRPIPGKTWHDIYDGLQRLTAISILVAMLRESWRDEAGRDALSALLFTDDGKQRLEVSTTGQSLASLLAGRKPRRGEMTDGDRRMRAASDIFERELQSWSDERREAFFAFLTNNVIFTVVEVSNASLAYTMFVTANDRGLALAVGDILKGQFVEQLHKAGGNAEQISKFAEVWRKAQGRLKESFNDFLLAVEALKFCPQDDEHEIEDHAPGELLIALFDDTSTAEEIMSWITGEFATMASAFEEARRHLGMPVPLAQAGAI